MASSESQEFLTPEQYSFVGEGEPTPRSTNYVYLYPKSTVIKTPSVDGTTFAIPAVQDVYYDISATTNAFNVTPPTVTVTNTDAFTRTGITPYSLGLRSGGVFQRTNLKWGGPLTYVYLATYPNGQTFYLRDTGSNNSEILLPTSAFSIALTGYYVYPTITTALSGRSSEVGNRHLSFTLEMDLSNYSTIPLKQHTVYDVIFYTNWGPPIWDLSGFNSLSGEFNPYPIVSSGGTTGNAFISRMKNDIFYISGTASGTVVTDVYNINNEKKYWVSFSFDIPIGCSAYMNNFTLGMGTVGLLFQETLDSALLTDMESAGGANTGLNNQNQQVENTFNQYEQATDTQQYYDKINTDLLVFDTTIWTQIAATSSLFSATITSIWSALGNFAVPLTLFLIAALVSLIVGIFRNYGGG